MRDHILFVLTSLGIYILDRFSALDTTEKNMKTYGNKRDQAIFFKHPVDTYTGFPIDIVFFQ